MRGVHLKKRINRWNLTYKSINATLQRLEEEGRLVRYLPPKGRIARRTLFLTASFGREIENGDSAINFFNQRRGVIGLLDRWVLGDTMTIRLAGKARGADLARLEPPPTEIWEFRVTDPKPQLRIFMRFAAPDVLIAFDAFNRDRLGKADLTNGRRGQTWQEAMYGCEAEWKRIFGRTEAFRGKWIGDYVTANAEECT